ncbi:hypothetical protein [Streptomyces sp. cg36]|uniref:hypothetical protein n=1 Tax=Streptomyces sp. cg36 TaxID=3238798 RepID=UPI0034E21B62
MNEQLSLLDLIEEPPTTGPAASTETVEKAEPPQRNWFPGTLQSGETIVEIPLDHPFTRQWTLTTVGGFDYRLTRVCDAWSVKRLPHDSGRGSDYVAELEPPLAKIMDWIRRDSRWRRTSRERFARHPHLPGGEIPFTLEPVVTRLEDGFWRVTRYGHEGRISAYPWGYEVLDNGCLPEDEKKGGLKWDYAVWSATAWAWSLVHNSQLTVTGTNWNTRAECAAGGPGFAGSCKTWQPSLKVQVADHSGRTLGQVVVCVSHMRDRFVPKHAVERAATAAGGKSSVWEERAAELVWDLVCRMERGQPLFDVGEQLLNEGVAAGFTAAERARRAAERKKR